MSEENKLPELRSRINEKALQKASELEKQQEFWARLQRFLELTNSAVEESKLQPHPIVKDCKYLPISFMEMSLDELFYGHWDTVNFHWQVIANEIVASIELKVLHPLSQMWITRTGAGAIQVMCDAIPEDEKKKMTRQEKNSWAINLDNKKPGALTNGGFAKLKADCFKNACISLGKYLGRDVNREHTAEDFLGTIKDPDERKSELRTQISDALLFCQDEELIQSITKEIIDAEDAGTNTIEFYKVMLTKVPGNGNN